MSNPGAPILVEGAGVLAMALALGLAETGTCEVWLTADQPAAVGNTAVAGAAIWLAPDDEEYPGRLEVAEEGMRVVQTLTHAERRICGLREGVARAELEDGQWLMAPVSVVSPVGFAAVLRGRAVSLGARLCSRSQYLSPRSRRIRVTGAFGLSEGTGNCALASTESVRYLCAEIGRTTDLGCQLTISYATGTYAICRGSRVVRGLFAVPTAAAAGEDGSARLAMCPVDSRSVAWTRRNTWPEIYNTGGFPALVWGSGGPAFRGGCGSGVRYAMGAARRAAEQLVGCDENCGQ